MIAVLNMQAGISFADLSSVTAEIHDRRLIICGGEILGGLA
jgi:hypothetical protein